MCYVMLLTMYYLTEFPTAYETGIISKMKKLRHREVWYHTKGHTAREWRSWNLTGLCLMGDYTKQPLIYDGFILGSSMVYSM